MYTQPKNRKDVWISVPCTVLEKKYLEVCARKAGQPVSRYLHGMLLQGYPKKPKVVPPDVLAAVSQLMQVAALLDPFSRKRLDGENFNALERAEAKDVIRQTQVLVKQIKNLIP